MIGNSEVGGGVIDFDPYNIRVFADTVHQLGALYEMNDYRAFRYTKTGAANTSGGKIQQAPAPIANHQNMSVLAAASQVNTIFVTPGATAGVAGIYDEGIASINAGPGAGQDYRVSHNPTITSSTQFALVLNDIIATALTSSSKVSLSHNAFNGSVESASSTRRAVGVPYVAITSTFQGWAQTKGISSTLADGAVAVGSDIILSGSVAGAIAIASSTYATALATPRIGSASIIAAVDTEYRPMVLTID